MSKIDEKIKKIKLAKKINSSDSVNRLSTADDNELDDNLFKSDK